MGEGEEKKGEGGGGEEGWGKQVRRGKRGRRRRISPLPISQPNPSKIYSLVHFFFKAKVAQLSN